MAKELFVDIVCKKPGFSLELNFACDAQNILGIMGASGAGKTLLLRSIAGLERDTTGLIRVDSLLWLDSNQKINMPPHVRKVGYVFQEARLFPHLTVEENIIFKTNNQKSFFTTLVNKLEISHVLNRMPIRLSGGEQQRVAIARALMSDPDILLLDEPLSALDKSLRSSLIDLMQDVFHDLNIPVVYVSHDADEMRALCKTTIQLPTRTFSSQSCNT